MNKKRWNKETWKKRRSLLAMGLSLILVTASLNLSNATEVHAENGIEASTEESKEISTQSGVDDDKELTKEQPTEATPSDAVSATGTAGTVSGNTIQKSESTEKTITAWNWAGSEDELEIQQDEAGAWGIGLPGVTIDYQADFDTVVSMLPTAITATVTVTGSGITADESSAQDSEEITDTDDETDREVIEELPVTWSCETYAKDETGNWPVSGDYIFKAELPEGYFLSSDTKKLEVTVQLGEAGVYLTPVTEGNYTYYPISSAEDLIAFASLVNGGQTTINAKLTQNIDMTDKAWTPIGTLTYKYAGTFDGNSYCIENISLSGVTDWVATFRNIGSSGTIKNLGVTGSFSGTQYVAGICASNSGVIENCWNGATITATSWIGAGIVAENYGTIRNCYNIGTISTPNENDPCSGGIVGYESAGGCIENCFNAGTVIGNAGAIVGADNDTKLSNIKACYYLENSAPRGTGGTSKTAEQLISGEVAWLLNGSNAGTSAGVWKQTIGTADYPSFSGDTVYNYDGTYSNTEKQTQAAPSTIDITVNSVYIAITASDSTVGTTLQYVCKEGDAELTDTDVWQESQKFYGLTAATKYTCYVRFAGNENYLASDAASRVFYTPSESPAYSEFTIDYNAETLDFDDTKYEVNTRPDFHGKEIKKGVITEYIPASNGSRFTLYARKKEVDSIPASDCIMIYIERRGETPDLTANDLSIFSDRVGISNSAMEFSMDQSEWFRGNKIFDQLGQDSEYTFYIRRYPDESHFASEIQTLTVRTKPATYTINIPEEEVEVDGGSYNISCRYDTPWDMGYNWNLSVSVVNGIDDSGYLNLTRRNDGAGTQIKTKVQVDGKYIGKNDTFELNKNKKSVGISALNPQNSSLSNGTIPAGSYEGIVTFRFTYSDTATQQ